MERSFTVAEIASAITTASAESWRPRLTVSDAGFANLVSEEKAVLIRRIRHWTLAGALLPIGSAHAGTGRHRRYGIEAIYEATILNKLAEWSVSIGVLKTVATTLRQYRARGDGRRLWSEAVAGRETVFLYAVPWAASDRGISDAPEIVLDLLPEKSLERLGKVTGAMILNLSMLFRDISL
jgi:hypothetical protein